MFKGIKLRELRKARKLSTKDLGEIIGRSQQYISDIELGRATPSLNTINRLANYFHVSADYLLGRTDKPKAFYIDDESIPDVMKPFKKINSEILMEVEDANDSGTAEERKKTIEEYLKSVNIMDNPHGLEELIDLLPDDLKNKSMSLYNLFYYIGNDENLMRTLEENDTKKQNKEITNTSEYEPLTEDEAIAVKAFLESFRKMKKEKNNA